MKFNNKPSKILSVSLASIIGLNSVMPISTALANPVGTNAKNNVSTNSVKQTIKDLEGAVNAAKVAQEEAKSKLDIALKNKEQAELNLKAASSDVDSRKKN